VQCMPSQRRPSDLEVWISVVDSGDKARIAEDEVASHLIVYFENL
jgi:hypothetical protein